METASSPAVLLLGLPPSALAGIDLLSFTVTPRFHGIKMLPPGFHFLFTGSSTAFSIRHGLWILVAHNTQSRPPLFITRWHAETETLRVEQDEVELLRWRANIGQYWREGLAPYRQSASDTAPGELPEKSNGWAHLTSYITPGLLSRISQGDDNNWSLTSASSAKKDRDEIPGINTHDFESADEKELCFLSVELKQTWREGATGRERTDAAKDRSWALRDIIQNCCAGEDANEILGELQFCFLMTLTLNNWSCFEQWKRLLTLLLTSKAAVTSHPTLFVDFLTNLRLQLQHCKDAEGGLIDLADEGGSLLKDLLVRFRRGLDDLQSLDTQEVVDELDDLEAFLGEEYGWQLGGSFAKSGVLELEDGEQVRMDTTTFDEEDETGEFAPQIVELTPEQASMLNINHSPELLSTLRNTTLHDNVASVHSSAESSDDDIHAQWLRSDEESDGSDEETAELEDLDSRY